MREMPVVSPDGTSVSWLNVMVNAEARLPVIQKRIVNVHGRNEGGYRVRTYALHSALSNLSNNARKIIPTPCSPSLQNLVLHLCNVDHNPLKGLSGASLLRASWGGSPACALARSEVLERIFSAAEDPHDVAPLLKNARLAHADVISYTPVDKTVLVREDARWFVDVALALHDVVRFDFSVELGMRLGHLLGLSIPLSPRLRTYPPPSGAMEVPDHPEWLQCVVGTPAFYIDRENDTLHRIFPGGFQSEAQAYIEACTQKKVS